MTEKGARLVLRLPAALETWLSEQAEKFALDTATYARLLLAERMSGERAPGTQPAPPNRVPNQGLTYASAPMEPATHDAAEPRAEDMDIPADPDGGDPGNLAGLFQEAGQVVDRLEQHDEPERSPPPSYLAPQPRYQRPPPPLAAQPGGYDAQNRRVPPGGMTRPVGVNQQVGYGDQMGDPHGNIIRRNFRHLGFQGGRS